MKNIFKKVCAKKDGPSDLASVLDAYMNHSRPLTDEELQEFTSNYSNFAGSLTVTGTQKYDGVVNGLDENHPLYQATARCLTSKMRIINEASPYSGLMCTHGIIEIDKTDIYLSITVIDERPFYNKSEDYSFTVYLQYEIPDSKPFVTEIFCSSQTIDDASYLISMLVGKYILVMSDYDRNYIQAYLSEIYYRIAEETLGTYTELIRSIRENGLIDQIPFPQVVDMYVDDSGLTDKVQMYLIRDLLKHD